MSKHLVIDVSEHQGVINWEAAKPHIAGAIIRCGYGDNYASQDDVQWSRNITECERLGIPRGVYLYSYATNDAMAQSELQHILRCLHGHSFQLPIYLDVEQAGTEGYAARACQIICEGLKAAGYKPGVYANTNWWNNYLTGVTAYTRWVAQYNSVCQYSGKHDIWQYTSDGSVPGINGRVDMNWCYTEFGSIAGGGTAVSTPTAASPKLKDLGQVDAIYEVYAGGRWWPPVTNYSDWAGRADGYPITYIAMKVSKGKVRARVHTANGWLPYLEFGNRYNKNDLTNGVLGNGNPIDAVEIYYYTPAGYKYKKAVYRVSDLKHSTFYSEQYDNETTNGMDGYAGLFGSAVDKFQMKIA